MILAESSLGKSLTLLRDQGLQAIDLRSSDSYRRILQRHIGFIEDYLEARTRFRVVVQQRKPTMIGLLGYESKIVYQICSSIEDLVKRAYQLENEEMILLTASGLTQALSLALDQEALGVFDRILNLLQLSLLFSLNVEDAPKRNRLLERLSSTVQGFSNYQLIAIHLEQTSKRIVSLPKFGKALILIFNQIIKQAIDKGDVRAVEILTDAVVGISSPRASQQDLPTDLFMLELRLKATSPSPAERSLLEEQATRLKQDIEFFQIVSESKKDILYGLGGWAIKRYQENQLTPGQIQGIMAKILPQLGGFEDLTRVYIKHQSDSQDPHGWSMWEAQERGEIRGGAFAPLSSDWFHTFYVLAGMRVISSSPNEDEIYGVIVRASIQSSLVEMLSTKIREVSNSIVAETPKWRILLPQLDERPVEMDRPQNLAVQGFEPLPNPAIVSFESLTGLWDRLLARRRSEEERDLVRADLSEGVLNDFETEFRKNWIQVSVFRGLARGYGFYEEHIFDQVVPETVKKWGLNQLDRKEWFLPGNSFALRSVAEHLGRGLGESETRVVFEAIISALRHVHVASAHEAKQLLDGFIDSVDPGELDSYIIITSFGYDFEGMLYMSEQFERVKKLEADEIERFRGRYRKIPVIPVWLPKPVQHPHLLCVNLRKLGIWRQYWTDRVGQELAISIQKIGEAEARTLLKANPKLRANEAGKEDGEDVAILRLQKNVHIQIWERFSYTVNEAPLAALRIDLRKAEPARHLKPQ